MTGSATPTRTWNRTSSISGRSRPVPRLIFIKAVVSSRVEAGRAVMEALVEILK